jgi:anti-sigma factor RsiW
MSEPFYSCREIVELVTEYLEGGLAPADRLAFERHVAICPPCRGYLAQMRKVVRVAGTIKEENLPESVRRDLNAVFADWKRERGGS